MKDPETAAEKLSHLACVFGAIGTLHAQSPHQIWKSRLSSKLVPERAELGDDHRMRGADLAAAFGVTGPSC